MTTGLIHFIPPPPGTAPSKFLDPGSAAADDLRRRIVLSVLLFCQPSIPLFLHGILWGLFANFWQGAVGVGMKIFYSPKKSASNYTTT